jgi:hypothetical protein
VPELELQEPRPQPTQAEESTSQLVTGRVLARLGRPRHLYRVTVKPLWSDHYRVNVYCTVDPDRPMTTVAMTDSFFVTVTADGITSSPEIERKYR